MTKFRVAVTGAQGVGKTTLARAIYDACRSVLPDRCNIMQGIGQHIKEMGLPMGAAATAETVYAFVREHLRRERTCAGELIIQDRCMLDLLAYVRVRRLIGPVPIDMLNEIALISLSRLDLLIFVPMCDALQPGSSDAESSDFRGQIDTAIPEVAAELGIPIVRVEGTPSERLNQSLRLISASSRGVYCPTT